MKKILLVEEDVLLNKTLTYNLIEEEGVAVATVTDDNAAGE